MNEDHLRALINAPEQWNARRQLDPDEFVPDFSHAVLRGVRLPHANFVAANLQGADLEGAFLPDARFDGAKADGAKFRAAHLQRASLEFGSFDRTNFTEADLSDAKLGGSRAILGARAPAHFTSAVFDRAQLSGATGEGTWFQHSSFRAAQLDEALFSRANLVGCNFEGANLSKVLMNRCVLNSSRFADAVATDAEFDDSQLMFCELSRADFSRSSLQRVNLIGCIGSDTLFRDAMMRHVEAGQDLRLAAADFSRATLLGANLTRAQLQGARLTDADLSMVVLVQTDLRDADLSRCKVYGVSAWEPQLAGALQQDLVITPGSWPEVTVDDLEVAQFLFLLLANEKLRKVIDTVARKAVLVLGRFTADRKPTLVGIKEELRRLDLVPIIFDFDCPGSRSLTETVSALAHLARFIVADLSDARSVPQELQKIIPSLPSVPVQPIICEPQRPYAMFADFAAYPSVLPPFQYASTDHLVASLENYVVAPALKQLEDIEQRRKRFESATAPRGQGGRDDA